MSEFKGYARKGEIKLLNDNQKIIENFRQMKTVSDKNHAKVFTEEDGFITLWSPVANFIVEEYEKILES